MSKPPTRPLKIEYVPIESLRPSERNARTHSDKQIDQIAASIRQFGFNNPVLIDMNDRIVAGHGRVRAASLLTVATVPILRLEHMNESQLRAYAIADNRLAELAGWDRDILRIELQELDQLDLDFALEITGFETSALDELLSDPSRDQDPADAIVEPGAGPSISNPGDYWRFEGGHVLGCADACLSDSYVPLMDDERARMVFTDPPFNCKIAGNVTGLGKKQHREFIAASGEMSDDEFEIFLSTSFASITGQLADGAICFICMDWRQAGLLDRVGKRVIGTLRNLIVWNKTNAGMGTFYRSKHELIFVFKRGNATHINNFGLGENGRYRTNVWDYPGVNTFVKGRDEALDMHPTVKNCAMVADAIRDVSNRGDIVLDGFGGSGTTLIAAHRTGRRARLLELDPLYCDVICRRFAAFTGSQPVHATTGRTFADLEREALALSESGQGGAT